MGRNEAKEISKEKSFACHALEFGLCVLITMGCYSKTNQGRDMIRFLCEELVRRQEKEGRPIRRMWE